ncbi:hypothetical protein BU25DRAFT_422717 [Macroventuria anomochaeta]|uniref:Uncharacterized protein n=1 Tax=Macroventuria anomochaeta TaxID=301207 RepID=A0ACB6RW47_9PLEO|nr:uncharacterized protein BU25DRAFT_422717 [Macroventuria anomochaeta]KAF2626141.1 hypothetical protein BU25DRAFT_422717 [Macroventuria anomochaeta]
MTLDNISNSKIMDLISAPQSPESRLPESSGEAPDSLLAEIPSALFRGLPLSEYAAAQAALQAAVLPPLPPLPRLYPRRERAVLAARKRSTTGPTAAGSLSLIGQWPTGANVHDYASYCHKWRDCAFDRRPLLWNERLLRHKTKAVITSKKQCDFHTQDGPHPPPRAVSAATVNSRINAGIGPPLPLRRTTEASGCEPGARVPCCVTSAVQTSSSALLICPKCISSRISRLEGEVGV